MEYKQIDVNFVTNSVFSSRTYWLTNDNQNEYWLVDCGDIDEVLSRLPDGSKILGALLTHVHFDHIYGLNKLIEMFPDSVVYTNEFGKQSLTDPKRNFSRYHTDVNDFVFEHIDNTRVIKGDDFVELFEGVHADVYYTPGHDDSCLCYLVDDYLFTGDAYIPGIKTVTTFPHSNKKKAQESLLKINSLPKGLYICPGHTIR